MNNPKQNWSRDIDAKRPPHVAYGRLLSFTPDGLVAIDIRTGVQLWHAQVGSDPLRMWVAGEEIITATNLPQPRLQAVDVYSGAIRLVADGGVELCGDPTLQSDRVVVGRQDQTVMGFGLHGGAPWLHDVHHRVESPIGAHLGAVFCQANKGQLWALSATDGAKIWKKELHGICRRRPIVLAGVLYVATDEGRIYALDPHTGSEHWSRKKGDGAKILSAPALFKDRLYIGSDDTNLYVLDASDGKTVATLPTGGKVRTSPVASEGIVYFGSDDGNMYAYDVSSGNTSTLQTGAESVRFDKTVVDDVAYFRADGRVCSSTFAELDRDFVVATQLLQGVETSDKSLKQSPKYISQIQVVEPKTTAPQPGMTVKVYATEPVTVSIGGVEYAIDENNEATVQTDGSGTIQIETDATELSTAGLLLWTSFMEPTERLAVYPDTGTHASLADVSADDLDKASGYPSGVATDDGPKVVKSKYRTVPDQMSAIASSISGTMAMTQGTSLGAVGGKYLASHESTDAEYVAQSGVMTRPLAAPTTPWHLHFDDQDNVAYEEPESDNELASLLEELGATSLSARSRAEISIGDLWDDLKSGAADLKHVVVHAVDGAEKEINCVISAVIEGVEKAYQFEIDEVEDAVDLVTAIFAKIANDLKHVLQWLSGALDWAQIKSNIASIRAMVDSAMKDLPSSATTLFGTLSAQVGDAKNDLSTTFQGLRNLVGNGSIGDLRGEASDPQSAEKKYGFGGASTQSAYYQSKARVGLGAGTGFAPPAVGALAGESVVQEFFATLSSQFDGDFLQSVKDAFSQLDTSSISRVLDESADVLIDAVEAIADTVLDIVIQLLTDAAKVVAALVSDGYLWSLMTSSMDIPVVSQLYDWLTGEALTPLNLAVLLAAIPATILSEAMANDEAGSSSAVGFQTMFFAWTPMAQSLANGSLDATVEADQDPKAGQTCLAVSIAVQFLASMGAINNAIVFSTDKHTSDSAKVTAMYAAKELLGMAMRVVAYCCENTPPRWWKPNGNLLITGSGVLGTVLLCVSAGVWPEGIDALGISAWLCSDIPNIANFLKLFSYDTLLEGIDAVGGTAEGILLWVIGWKLMVG